MHILITPNSYHDPNHNAIPNDSPDPDRNPYIRILDPTSREPGDDERWTCSMLNVLKARTLTLALALTRSGEHAGCATCTGPLMVMDISVS